MQSPQLQSTCHYIVNHFAKNNGSKGHKKEKIKQNKATIVITVGKYGIEYFSNGYFVPPKLSRCIFISTPPPPTQVPCFYTMKLICSVLSPPCEWEPIICNPKTHVHFFLHNNILCNGTCSETGQEDLLVLYMTKNIHLRT